MNKEESLFNEKYEPKRIKDLLLDDLIEIKINDIISSKKIENLIFCGPPGVGKTCAIKCIVRSIYCKENKNMIFEPDFNERGIKSISDIETFCKKKSNIIEGYCENKLLILNDADTITARALKSYGSLINKYPKTMMIFTCNDCDKINESIQSKCSVIMFRKIPMEKYLKRLKYICELENIEYDEEGLKYLYRIYNNDIGKILSTVELISVSNDKITIDVIDKTLSIPPESDIRELINYIVKKDKRSVIKMADDFEKRGFYCLDILLSIIKYHEIYDIDDDLKINILKNLSIESYEMSKNDSKYLHFTAALIKCIDDEID
jgi:DNA polymerase III delta prime subunit